MTDAEQAMKGDWDKDFVNDGKKKSYGSSNSNNRDLEFMKMDKEGTYKVRLVGSYIKFRRWWKPYRAITLDEWKDQDPAWKAGFYPQQRFAVNVIDRADGKLKILEKGASVFERFKDYKKVTGTDPNGPEAPDFAITVEIPTDENGQPNKLKTSYGVTSLNKAPLSAEDKKVVCKTDEEGNIVKDENGKPISNLYPLSKIFWPTPIDKMEEMWENLPEDKKQPPKRKNNDDYNNNASSGPALKTTEGEITTEPISDPVADTSSSDDELFSSEGGDDSTDLF